MSGRLPCKTQTLWLACWFAVLSPKVRAAKQLMKKARWGKSWLLRLGIRSWHNSKVMLLPVLPGVQQLRSWHDVTFHQTIHLCQECWWRSCPRGLKYREWLMTWNACAGRRSKSIEWQFRGSALNHFFWCLQVFALPQGFFLLSPKSQADKQTPPGNTTSKRICRRDLQVEAEAIAGIVQAGEMGRRSNDFFGRCYPGSIKPCNTCLPLLVYSLKSALISLLIDINNSALGTPLPLLHVGSGLKLFWYLLLVDLLVWAIARGPFFCPTCWCFEPLCLFSLPKWRGIGQALNGVWIWFLFISSHCAWRRPAIHHDCV